MSALAPDRSQIETFVNALFRYAGGDGFISIRSFYDTDSTKPFRISPTALKNDGLKFVIDVAEDDASRAANHPKPVVFCPPIAVFAGARRARERDIVLGLALSVECDQKPQAARARLEQMLGPATVVVASGGRWTDPATGEEHPKLHLHWRLSKPAAKDAIAKLKRARELATRLTGADPSNKPICHPIRWPGSWHRKGAAVLCCIDSADPDREIDLDAALAALTGATGNGHDGQPAAGRTREADDWDALVEDITRGRNYHDSLLRLAARMAGGGTSCDAIIKALHEMMDASTGPRDARWQARVDSIPSIANSAVEKFAAKVDDDIARLNTSHAVLPIGGKTRVVRFGEMEEFPGRTTIVMTQTFGDFVALQNKYRHEYIDKDGKIQSIPLGSYWLSSLHRRQYMPCHDDPVVGGRLNLWCGYGVKPIKPDGKSGAAGCDKFLSFMHAVVCGGNGEHFDYLEKREAFILQKRKRTEIAVALHTLQEGAGKGFYEKHMGHLLGNHAMQVTNPRHVIGNFNPHLETLLRLTADEALFVGNPEHRNALFGLITEPKLTIEPKGCGVYPADNYLNISITSNNEHFVPVSGTARRFFVPTVSPAHMQDFDYFRAIEGQLRDDHGYEALLYHMLHEVDLKDFDVRKVPRTAGLIEQAAYGRRGVDGLVEQVCNEARVPCEHEEWPGFTVTTGQEQDTGFYSFMDKHRDREIAGRGLMVIRRLRNEWGCTTGMQRRERASDRTSGFQWPPLAKLRARFEERFGKQAWANAQVTEWTVPQQDEPEQIVSKWASELTGQTFTRRLVLEEERDGPFACLETEYQHSPGFRPGR